MGKRNMLVYLDERQKRFLLDHWFPSGYDRNNIFDAYDVEWIVRQTIAIDPFGEWPDIWVNNKVVTSINREAKADEYAEMMSLAERN